MIFNTGSKTAGSNVTAETVPYGESTVAQELTNLSNSVSGLTDDISTLEAKDTSLTSSVNSLTTRAATLENELTANGKRIYLDYKDGKYGYNTDAQRGADTFSPFKSGGDDSELTVLNTMNSATNDLFSQMFNFKDFLVDAKMPPILVNFLGTASDKIYDIISYSGIQILIFLSAIQSVPRHLYEAAKIEGATAYESFWKITLPMVSPQIITVVVYTIVDSFLRSGINKVIDYQYTQAFYGKHAAMSWIYVIASILILAIAVGILNKVVFYQDDKK